MYARVSEVRILPGKWTEYLEAIHSVLPILRKQAGFRAGFLLRNDGDAGPGALVVTLWDTHDDLKASEKNLFLYQAIARTLSFCEGFPRIREHEVAVSEFAPAARGTQARGSAD